MLTSEHYEEGMKSRSSGQLEQRNVMDDGASHKGQQQETSPFSQRLHQLPPK
jgi:hypothetical protein